MEYVVKTAKGTHRVRGLNVRMNNGWEDAHTPRFWLVAEPVKVLIGVELSVEGARPCDFSEGATVFVIVRSGVVTIASFGEIEKNKISGDGVVARGHGESAMKGGRCVVVRARGTREYQYYRMLIGLFKDRSGV